MRHIKRTWHITLYTLYVIIFYISYIIYNICNIYEYNRMGILLKYVRC